MRSRQPPALFRAKAGAAAPSDDFGATFCELPGSAPDTEEMIVARDDVWIYMSTSNRNGRAFLSDIATQIWG